MKRGLKVPFRMFFVSVLSLSLIVSFGLHTIQVEHAHPGAKVHHTHSGVGIEIDEYLHGIEQKFFLVLLFLIVIGAWTSNKFLEKYCGVTFDARFPNVGTGFQLIKRRSRPLSFIRFLLECFRKGILHPKLF